ncbi:glycosyltransferase, partial [Citrobacter sp. Awk 4]|uniref:glycosyltransferase n=1 Tax=Citrobacter sp. Awk 4 TaxID=2963955 RepID=UPI0023046CE6
IYPAAEYEYKNHAVIIQALSMLGNEYLKENNVSVLFTIPANSYLDKKTKTMDIYKHVRFIGSVNQEELNRLYSTSFCLLFPSKIESFGLPLIEGACKGVKIITADLPYAREALQDYASTHFVDPDDASKWAYKLKSLIEKDDNKTETFEYKDDWAKFNKIIDDVFFSN